MIYKYVVLPESGQLRQKTRRQEPGSNGAEDSNVVEDEKPLFNPGLLFISRSVYSQARRVMFENTTYNFVLTDRCQILEEQDIIAIQNIRKLHLKVQLHSSWNFTQKEYDSQNRPFLRRSVPDLLATRSDQNVSLKIDFVFDHREYFTKEMKRQIPDATDIFDPSLRFAFKNFPITAGGTNDRFEFEYLVAWMRSHLVENIHRIRADLEAQAPFVKFETNVDVRGHNVLVAWIDSDSTYIKDQERGINAVITIKSNPLSGWLRKVSGDEIVDSGVGNFC